MLLITMRFNRNKTFTFSNLQFYYCGEIGFGPNIIYCAWIFSTQATPNDYPWVQSIKAIRGKAVIKCEFNDFTVEPDCILVGQMFLSKSKSCFSKSFFRVPLV
jgi:hypothetical protein